EEPFSITLREDVPIYVHIHSQDAAGNQEVTQTVELPLAGPAPGLELTVESAHRCVVGKAVTTVRVLNGSEVPVDVTIGTTYGARTFSGVAPGRTAFPAFTTRLAEIPAGTATVTATGVCDGEDVTETRAVPYEAFSCQ